jgi:Trk-type K+ transport system membrane component
MGAALSIFVILSLSIFVIRIASVALRFTGIPEAGARFQALSAFSGTGFTTSEAEIVVNYPVRRRIVSILMVLGNMGVVTVFATLAVSLVRTEGDVGAVIV